MKLRSLLTHWGWGVVWSCLVVGESAFAQRYVPDAGTFDQVVGATQSGETVIVRAGNHLVKNMASLTGKSDVTIRGEVGSVIYAAQPAGTEAALKLSGCTRITLQGLTFEGAFQWVRGIRVTTSCTTIRIRSCEVRHFGFHAIDCDARSGTIEDSSTHHNLSFANGVRADAHGIVTMNSNGMIIRRCKSYCNSGDSFQADRGAWTTVLVENCDFWDEPVPDLKVSPQFGTLFPNPVLPVGLTTSENAIDTKHLATSTGSLTLRDVRMSGFTMTQAPTFVASALVLKEKVNVKAYRCIVKNCEVGWRVRCWSNSMPCTLDMINCWTESCAAGFRLEDGPSNLTQTIRLCHNTFKNCTSPTVMAPSTTGFYGNSSVTNCLVQGSSLPSQFKATLGNTNVAGAKGVTIPTWTGTNAATDLVKLPRPTSSPTAGALETYP